MFRIWIMKERLKHLIKCFKQEYIKSCKKQRNTILVLLPHVDSKPMFPSDYIVACDPYKEDSSIIIKKINHKIVYD